MEFPAAHLQGRLWRNLALLACFFLLLFSINAKVSLYRAPTATARAVSASKMQESSKAQTARPADLAPEAPLFVLLFLCVCAPPILLRVFSARFKGLCPPLEFAYAHSRFQRPPPTY